MTVTPFQTEANLGKLQRRFEFHSIELLFVAAEHHGSHARLQRNIDSPTINVVAGQSAAGKLPSRRLPI